METTTVAHGAVNIANALWTLIEPQDRNVKEYLEILIHKSLAKENGVRKAKKQTRSEMFAQILKDVRPTQGGKLSQYSTMENYGVDLNLPADFDEKKEYRKYLEEKYR